MRFSSIRHNWALCAPARRVQDLSSVEAKESVYFPQTEHNATPQCKQQSVPYESTGIQSGLALDGCVDMWAMSRRTGDLNRRSKEPWEETWAPARAKKLHMISLTWPRHSPFILGYSQMEESLCQCNFKYSYSAFCCRMPGLA